MNLDKSTDKSYNHAGRGKTLLTIVAIILAYLFALNGRYIKMDDRSFGEDGAVFDKWTQNIFVIDNEGNYKKLSDHWRP